MQVQFPVNINSLGTLTGLSFGLNFDPSILAVSSVQLGASIGGLLSVEKGSNYVGIGIGAASVPSGQGPLVVITFDVILEGVKGTTNITWANSSQFPTVFTSADGSHPSFGGNTGIIHLPEGTAEALTIQITGETVNRVPVPTPGPTPTPTPIPEPVPVTPNPINTTVPPAPIITGDPTPTPTPVTTTTPTATGTSELSTLLTGFSLTSILANHTALLLGGGAALFFLTRKKKRTSKKF